MKSFALAVLCCLSLAACGIPDEPFACTPRTACDGAQCQVIDDGCGGTLTCGASQGRVCCNDGTTCDVGYPYECPNVRTCFNGVPTQAECDSSVYFLCE